MLCTIQVLLSIQTGWSHLTVSIKVFYKDIQIHSIWENKWGLVSQSDSSHYEPQLCTVQHSASVNTPDSTQEMNWIQKKRENTNHWRNLALQHLCMTLLTYRKISKCFISVLLTSMLLAIFSVINPLNIYCTYCLKTGHRH